jgi:hypothetical protein
VRAPHLPLRRRRVTEPRRLLVAVDEACTSPALCASVRVRSTEGRIEVFVVSPAHGTAATQWYADEDAARADAVRRLRGCIACLAGEGIPTRGELAVADPVEAIGNALERFAADRILIVTAPQRPSTWLRRNAVERARRTFPQPVEHVVMPAVR